MGKETAKIVEGGYSHRRYFFVRRLLPHVASLVPSRAEPAGRPDRMGPGVPSGRCRFADSRCQDLLPFGSVLVLVG